MVAITSGSSISTIQGIIDANPAGTTYEWDAGTTRFDNILTFKDGDIHIGAVDGNGDPTTIWKGSIVLTGFVLDTGNYKKTGVTEESADGTFSPSESWTEGKHNDPEDLFYNGDVLWERAALGSIATGPLTPDPGSSYTFQHGSWYYDRGGNTVWMPFDPSSGTVELGVQNRAMSATPDDCTVQNIHMTQFANQAQQGLHWPSSGGVTGWTFLNCWFSYNHGNGLKTSTGTLAEDCKIFRNGQLGISFTFGGGSEESFCEVYENNIAGFNPAWEAGGMKHWETTNLWIHDNYYHGNFGWGLWCDNDHIYTLYELNASKHNTRIGQNHEISFDAEMRYNWLQGNGSSGDGTAWWDCNMISQNSRNVWMHHNYVECDPFRVGIVWISQNTVDPGDVGRGVSPKFGLVWEASGCLIENNIINGPPGGSSARWMSGGKTDGGISTLYGPRNIQRNNVYHTPRANFANEGNFFWLTNSSGTIGQWNAIDSGQFLTQNETYVLSNFSSEGLLSGDFNGSAEQDIVAGGRVITITMNGGDWWNTRIGTDSAENQALLDAIVANESETNGWNNEVQPALDHTHVTRVSADRVDITLPAVGTYNITADETFDITIPGECLASRNNTSTDLTMTVTVGVNSPNVTVSGTLQPSKDETQMRTNSYTVIFTIANDTLVTGTQFDDSRQALIDAFESQSLSEPNGFDNTIKPAMVVTDVARTSSTVVTVTITPTPSYDIIASETIQVVNFPSSMLVTSTQNLAVGPIATITPVGTGSATFGGNLNNTGESTVNASGSSFTIVLSNDIWVASGATFDAQRQNIIDGLVSAANQVGGFNDTLKPGIEVADVVRTSDTVVTVTIDANANYLPHSNDVISGTIPGTALAGGGSIVVDNTMKILVNRNAKTKTILNV